MHRTRAFALVELACLVVLAAVLLIVLVGVGHGSRRAAGIQASVDRLRRHGQRKRSGRKDGK